MFFYDIRRPLGRMAVFSEFRFLEECFERRFIRCRIEVPDGGHQGFFCLRDGERQSFEIRPQELAALGDIGLQVVCVEKDRHAHEGCVEHRRGIVCQQGITSRQGFKHVGLAAHVDDGFRCDAARDMARRELGMQTEEDFPCSPEPIVQCLAQRFEIWHLVVLLDAANRALAAAAECRRIHQELRTVWDSIVPTQAATTFRAIVYQDVIARRTCSDIGAIIEQAVVEHDVFHPAGIRQHEVRHISIMLAHEIRDLGKRCATLQADGLGRQAGMPCLHVELPRTLPDFELLAAVVHPDGSRRQFIGAMRERIGDDAHIVREWQAGVIDEPDEVVGLLASRAAQGIAAAQLFADVLGVAPIADRALDVAENDLVPVDWIRAAAVKRPRLPPRLAEPSSDVSILLRHAASLPSSFSGTTKRHAISAASVLSKGNEQKRPRWRAWYAVLREISSVDESAVRELPSPPRF